MYQLINFISDDEFFFISIVSPRRLEQAPRQRGGIVRPLALSDFCCDRNHASPRNLGFGSFSVVSKLNCAIK